MRRLVLTALAMLIGAVPAADAATVSWSTPGTYDWTVPAGVTSVDLDLSGAAGGTGFGAGCNGCIYRASIGGAGGKVTGTVAVTPGDVVRVVVGGAGSIQAAGYNGGGASAGTYVRPDWGMSAAAGSGGGATDVRVGGVDLVHRVAVAGGGGGASSSSLRTSGGAGGGLSGAAGMPVEIGGGAGTQLEGGAGQPGAGAGTLGAGGAGDTDTWGNAGGGGGGGLYGGGGGDTREVGGGGGGGGSSLVPPGGTTAAGVNSGDGIATLTYETGIPGPKNLVLSPASPSNATTVTLTGTAPAGATVAVYASTDCTGTPVATGNADELADPGLSFTVPSDATTRVTARASLGGEDSACADPLTYVEDSTAPEPPGSFVRYGASPSAQNTFRLTGQSVEWDTTVRAYATADCTGTPLATASADTFAGAGLSITVADDTTTTVRVTATDPAGNASACTEATTYVEDSTAPGAPTALALTPGSPGSDPTPDVGGSAEDGATVRVYADDACGGTAAATAAAAGGTWTAAVTAARNATRSFSARATDAAGNAGPCSAPIAYLHDDIAPAAPALTGVTPLTGTSGAQPRATGTVPADAVQVRLFAGACGGAPAASVAPGAFTGPGVEVPVPADTPVLLRAAAVDAAGNVSACSTPFEHLRDTLAPAVAITAPGTGATVGAVPVIAGTAGSGAGDRPAVTVELERAGAVVATMTTARDAAGGAWSVQPGAALAPGTYTARARQRDDAGTTGTSAPVTFTVAAAPEAPIAPPPTVTPPPAPPAPRPAATRRNPLFVSAVRASARGDLVLRVSTPGAGRLELAARTKAFRLGARAVRVASAADHRVTLASSAEGRRRLAGATDRRVEVRVTFTAADGRRERLAVPLRLPATGGRTTWRVVEPRVLLGR